MHLKILVAEDDKISAVLLARALKGISKEILFACNGTEAVEMARKHPDIDLIMMDIKMPEMNGLEATRAIPCISSGVGDCGSNGVLSGGG